jgi:exopolysaccharide biosynthesis polyprenyl glycosylphosphotransferase
MTQRSAAFALSEISVLVLIVGMRTLPAQPTAGEWSDLVWHTAHALAPVLCYYISFYYNDLYDLRAVKNFGEFSARVPQSLGVALILLSVLYALFPELSPAQGPLLGSLSNLLLIVASVLPLRWALYVLMRGSAERVLILGTSPLAQKIVQEIESLPHLGHTIVGFVGEDGALPVVGTVHPPYPLFGALERVDTIIQEVRPERVIVALSERRGRLPVRALLHARMNGVVVEDGIEVYERLTEKLAIESLTPSFFIFAPAFKKRRLQLTLRRATSLIVAGAGLVLSAPLMVLVAAAIKLDSRGPVFFLQERAGLRGRTFCLIKFRTMHPAPEHDDAESVWNRDVSSRITRVGKWLRFLRFDELPQFVNILRGDMDLVGPRPEIASNVKTMMEDIPFYALRTVVRPGITGWAQIKYGYAVSREDVTEKMRYDLYYIKQMSLWFDLRILASTVKTVLLGQGSEVSRSASSIGSSSANEVERVAQPAGSVSWHSSGHSGKSV